MFYKTAIETKRSRQMAGAGLILILLDAFASPILGNLVDFKVWPLIALSGGTLIYISRKFRTNVPIDFKSSQDESAFNIEIRRYDWESITANIFFISAIFIMIFSFETIKFVNGLDLHPQRLLRGICIAALFGALGFVAALDRRKRVLRILARYVEVN